MRLLRVLAAARARIPAPGRWRGTSVVKERRGHRSITTTEKYLHTLPGADETALAALDRIRATPATRPRRTVRRQVRAPAPAQRRTMPGLDAALNLCNQPHGLVAESSDTHLVDAPHVMPVVDPRRRRVGPSHRRDRGPPSVTAVV